ncbi:MAG: hypothetical protein ACOCRX_07020 [Candidatus Woesearchaeota archaeon]
MKPSEVDLKKLSRQIGKTNANLIIFFECLRQDLLGIDENIENNINVSIKKIKIN